MLHFIVTVCIGAAVIPDVMEHIPAITNTFTQSTKLIIGMSLGTLLSILTMPYAKEENDQ